MAGTVLPCYEQRTLSSACVSMIGIPLGLGHILAGGESLIGAIVTPLHAIYNEECCSRYSAVTWSNPIGDGPGHT
jgi:hypothetical protein